MSIVAYKNVNTGQVVSYTNPNPRLEASQVWKTVDAGQVTLPIADAHDRAAAERESIEAAAAIRLDSAAGAAAAGLLGATAANTPAGGPGTAPGPLPTLSTGNAGEVQNIVPMLDKDDPSRASATTPFEENKRLAEQEIASPPREGVLKRAKRDHKTGATQIGDNPEEHPGPRASKAAAGARPADNAGKEAWVDYAERRGADRGVAAGKTTRQLIAEYGA